MGYDTPTHRQPKHPTLASQISFRTRIGVRQVGLTFAWLFRRLARRVAFAATVSQLLAACSASTPAASLWTPSRKSDALEVERYEGTSIDVSEVEAAAVRGNPDAVREFLTSIRHSDGEVAEYLCQYPFPKILASQPRLVIEQAQNIGDDILRRMADCIHFSMSGRPAGADLARLLRRMEFETENERHIREALASALETPDPSWP